MKPRRKPKKLTRQQQSFVHEYLIDLSPADAYIRAGYRVASRVVAWKASNRLLKNVEVSRAIEEAQCERMERLKLTADTLIQRFNLIYLLAMMERDYRSALKALVNMGRYFGIFEKHNSQKRRAYTQEDAEKLKAKLEALGVDFTRKNFPVELMTEEEREKEIATLQRRIERYRAAGTLRQLPPSTRSISILKVRCKSPR